MTLPPLTPANPKASPPCTPIFASHLYLPAAYHPTELGQFRVPTILATVRWRRTQVYRERRNRGYRAHSLRKVKLPRLLVHPGFLPQCHVGLLPPALLGRQVGSLPRAHQELLKHLRLHERVGLLLPRQVGLLPRTLAGRHVGLLPPVPLDLTRLALHCLPVKPHAEFLPHRPLPGALP